MRGRSSARGRFYSTGQPDFKTTDLRSGERNSPRGQSFTGDAGSNSVGFDLNFLVADAVAFGIEVFREPLVRVLIGVVGASVFGDALHSHRADLLGDGAGFEIPCDGRANKLGVGG